MLHSAEYWQKRAEGRMDIYQNNADEYLKTLKKSYRKAIKNLKEDSNRLIVNYVKANDLSVGQATKLLALFNGQKIRDIDDLIPMDLDEETRTVLERFKADPAYSHRMQVLIDRLNNVDKVVNNLGEEETTGVRRHLMNTTAEAFDRNMFDLQQGTGVGFSFTRPDERALRAMVNENWTGRRTFSQSIWGHFQTANQTIQKELITSFLTGRSYERTADALSKRMSVAYYQAERLVRTETTHAAVQGEMSTYKEAGIDEYQFLSTLDSRTCAECGALDGKVFRVSEQKPGINCPPMHANCRCTTVIPDNVDAERLAKDKDGKYYKVSADMTYEEWRKSLISEGKSGKIISGAISGARNPFGEKAQEHADKYYGLVRSMKTDVSKIAQTTGLPENKIQEVKDFIFYEKHDLGGAEKEYFKPDYMMGESWKRLIDGKPEPHDITLINHEITERDLMKQGYTQAEAHTIASGKYNYAKEAAEFYDKIEKYKD